MSFITLLLHFIAELCYSGEFCHKKEHKVPLKYFVFLNIILKNQNTTVISNLKQDLNVSVNKSIQSFLIPVKLHK